jgi:hypothetical protein
MSPWRWQCGVFAWTHWEDTDHEVSFGGGNVWRRVVFGLWRRVDR